jgi:hypothetical protein
MVGRGDLNPRHTPVNSGAQPRSCHFAVISNLVSGSAQSGARVSSSETDREQVMRQKKRKPPIVKADGQNLTLDLPYVALLVAIATPYAYMICLFLVESYYSSLGARWAVKLTLPSELIYQGGIYISIVALLVAIFLYLHSAGRLFEKTGYYLMMLFAITFFFWDPTMVTQYEQQTISAVRLNQILSICSVYVIAYGVSRLVLLRTHPFDSQFKMVIVIGMLIMHSMLGPRYYGVVKANSLIGAGYRESLIYSDVDPSDARLILEKCSGGYLVRLESKMGLGKFKLMPDLNGFHHL